MSERASNLTRMFVSHVCTGGDAEADLSLHPPDKETTEAGRRQRGRPSGDQTGHLQSQVCLTLCVCVCLCLCWGEGDNISCLIMAVSITKRSVSLSVSDVIITVI